MGFQRGYNGILGVSVLDRRAFGRQGWFVPLLRLYCMFRARRPPIQKTQNGHADYFDMFLVVEAAKD